LVHDRAFWLGAALSRRRISPAVFFLLAIWALGGSNVSGASRVWSGLLNTDFENAGDWDVLLPPSAPVNDTTTDIGVFSGAVPQTETGVAWKANSVGTLIFGIREYPETDELYANRFLHQRDKARGALTFRSHSTFGFGRELSRRELNSSLTARTLDPRIAELPSVRTIALSVSELDVSGGSGGLAITSMQITLADQSVFVGEETDPVPEPSTWFAAALVAGAIAWSQRHHFVRRLKSL
jgi:hypothetical protein